MFAIRIRKERCCTLNHASRTTRKIILRMKWYWKWRSRETI